MCGFPPVIPELIDSQHEQSTGANTAQFLNVDDFYRTYDNAILTEAEQVFRNEANKYRPDERDKFLIRVCATVFWLGVFELNYCASFGSQLKALEDLNTNSDGMTIENLRTYYTKGLETVPPEFRNRSFDAWLAWLRDTAILIRQQGDTAYITVRGHEFLKYIISRRYPMERAG
jgi:hypothetical protein